MGHGDKKVGRPIPSHAGTHFSPLNLSWVGEKKGCVSAKVKFVLKPRSIFRSWRGSKMCARTRALLCISLPQKFPPDVSIQI